jgi:hypothetical protein
MGAEPMHRALARQSLGARLGNDRGFIEVARRSPSGLATTGCRRFYASLPDAVTQL